MATHTPSKPNLGAKNAPRGMRIPHMLKRFMQLGIRVSPAPLKTPEATIDAAYIGSAKASMRRTFVPRARIASSGDNIPIIKGAKAYKSTPVPAITAIPRQVASHPSRLVISFLPAPMLWPIRVVAAVPIPYPGI
jgi:hypothetical protein